MADFQLDVPQQGQQFAHFLRLLVRQLFAAQDQQIDIRQRVQLATAIAADRHQRDVGQLAKTVINPQTLQELIDKFRARLNQRFGGDPAVKGLAQPALESVDMRFNTRARQLGRGPDAGVIRLTRKGGECRIGILFG